MEKATSKVKVIKGGKPVEYVAEYSLPETPGDTGHISEDHLMAYIRAGMQAEAEREHRRLVIGGYKGKDRPTDEEIVQIMSMWTPGQNYLAEKRAKEAEKNRVARVEKLRAKLVTLEAATFKEMSTT
jgi:hypothetical protein